MGGERVVAVAAVDAGCGGTFGVRRYMEEEQISPTYDFPPRCRVTEATPNAVFGSGGGVQAGVMREAVGGIKD